MNNSSKKSWGKPIVQVQLFVPQEYIASCWYVDKSDMFTTLYEDGKGWFNDPDGNAYNLNVRSLASSSSDTTLTSMRTDATSAQKHTIDIFTAAYCNGESPTYKAGTNNYAIAYKLEGAGTACLDNQ